MQKHSSSQQQKCEGSDSPSKTEHTGVLSRVPGVFQLIPLWQVRPNPPA